MATLKIVPQGTQQFHLQLKPGTQITVDLSSSVATQGTEPKSSTPSPKNSAPSSAPPKKTPSRPKPKIGLPPVVVPQTLQVGPLYGKASLYVANPDIEPNELVAHFETQVGMQTGEHQYLMVPLSATQPIDVGRWIKMAEELPAEVEVFLLLQSPNEQ